MAKEIDRDKKARLRGMLMPGSLWRRASQVLFPSAPVFQFGNYTDCLYIEEEPEAYTLVGNWILRLRNLTSTNAISFIARSLCPDGPEEIGLERCCELVGIGKRQRKTGYEDPHILFPEEVERYRKLWKPDHLKAKHSLYWEEKETPSAPTDYLKLEEISPHPLVIRSNPTVDEGLLASSRREIPHVIVVPGNDGKFLLVCGSRRYQRAKLAEERNISAQLHILTEEEILRIQYRENANRQDFNHFEKAQLIEQLIAALRSKGSKAPKKQTAQELKLPVEEISRYLSVLRIPRDYWEVLTSVSFSKVWPIGKADDEAQMREMIQEVVGNSAIPEAPEVERTTKKKGMKTPKTIRLPLQLGDSKHRIIVPISAFPEDADEQERLKLLKKAIDKRLSELEKEK